VRCSAVSAIHYSRRQRRKANSSPPCWPLSRKFERSLIAECTGQGRKRAMAAGVKFSRKRKLYDYQRKEALRRRAEGETLAEIAKSYAVDISMILRLKPAA
jgi:DNA invertase Pin-like site-specific DNA recombinase